MSSAGKESILGLSQLSSHDEHDDDYAAISNENNTVTNYAYSDAVATATTTTTAVSIPAGSIMTPLVRAERLPLEDETTAVLMRDRSGNSSSSGGSGGDGAGQQQQQQQQQKQHERKLSYDPPGQHMANLSLQIQPSSLPTAALSEFSKASPWRRGSSLFLKDPPGSFSGNEEETNYTSQELQQIEQQANNSTASRSLPKNTAKPPRNGTNTPEKCCYQVVSRPCQDPFQNDGLYTGFVMESAQQTLPHGHGRFDYQHIDRALYEGEWSHGHWNGHGRHVTTTPAGEMTVYEGEFQHDVKHGQGRMQFADGRVFDGQYENGQMLRGTLTYSDGSVFRGEFTNDLPQRSTREPIHDEPATITPQDHHHARAESEDAVALIVESFADATIINSDWVKSNDAPQPPPPFDPATKITTQRFDGVKIRKDSGELCKGQSVITVDDQRGYWIGPKIFDTFYGHVCEGRLVHKKQKKRLLQPDTEEWSVLGAMDRVAIKLFSLEKIQANDELPEDPEVELAAIAHVRQRVAQDQAAVASLIAMLELWHDSSDYMYFVTPFYDRKLHDIVREMGPLPEAQAREWFQQILSGISGLQSAGVSHRHLSSWDVMIHNNVAVLLHFGVAIRVPVSENGQRQLITPMKQCGRYPAPEIYREEAFDGFAVDLWSAGVILYFMLVGKVPWVKPIETDSAYDRIARQARLAEEVAAVSLDHSLSIEVVDLLQSMLREDPRDRVSLKQIWEHPWMTLERFPAGTTGSSQGHC